MLLNYIYNQPGVIAIVLIVLLLIIYFLRRYLPRKDKKITIEMGNAQRRGKRKRQEDSFTTIENQKGVLAVVADGMGGLSFGKQASGLATRVFANEFSKPTNIISANDFLIDTLHEGNKELISLGRERRTGTTLLAVLIRDNLLFWISVGDSQLYLYRDNNLAQVNPRHIYANKLEEDYNAGKITKNELDNHPKRERLTTYLGYSNFSKYDYSQVPLRLQSGDKLLLCTDGIYKALYDVEIAEILEKDLHPMETAEIMLERVLEKNLRQQDNSTAIVLKIK